jgi:hypothetical protein
MINKKSNISNSREEVIQPEFGEFKLLQDLVESAVDNNSKIIASMFLFTKSTYAANDSSTSSSLILKPKCLWLKQKSGSTLLEDVYGNTNDTSNSIKIPTFKDYKVGEKIKVSFLEDGKSVADLLTEAGLQGIASDFKIGGLLYVFEYDINELNRTRNTSTPVTSSGSSSGNIWL